MAGPVKANATFLDDFSTENIASAGWAPSGMATPGNGTVVLAGHTWTVTAGLVAQIDGSNAGFTSGVYGLWNVGGTIWVVNVSDQWYFATGTIPASVTWTAGAAPVANAWITQYPFFNNEFHLPAVDEREYMCAVQPGYHNSTAFQPFSVSNSTLSIKAQSVTGSGDTNPDGQAWNGGNITSCHYTNNGPSAGLFSFQYGYVETYCQCPTGGPTDQGGPGAWAQLVLYPLSGVGPAEIDVFEVLGATPNVVRQTIHSNAGTTLFSPTTTNIGYHRIGVDWQADFTTFYVDGVQTGQIATPSDLKQAFYINCGLAIAGSGSWTGTPANTNLVDPVLFEIDYIGVWPNFASAYPTPSIRPWSTDFSFAFGPAGDINLTPAQNLVTFNGFVPVAAGSLIIPLPGPASIVISGIAPTVTVAASVNRPWSADFSSDFGPQGDTGVIAGPQGSVVVTGFAPNVGQVADQTLTPGAGSVVLTGKLPVLSTSIRIGIPSSIPLTGFAPSVDTSLLPGAGSGVFTGASPSVDQSNVPPIGSLVFTGRAPSANMALLPGAGSIVITGKIPLQGLNVNPTTGTVAVRGFSPLSVAGTAPRGPLPQQQLIFPHDDGDQDGWRFWTNTQRKDATARLRQARIDIGLIKEDEPTEEEEIIEALEDPALSIDAIAQKLSSHYFARYQTAIRQAQAKTDMERETARRRQDFLLSSAERTARDEQGKRLILRRLIEEDDARVMALIEELL